MNKPAITFADDLYVDNEVYLFQRGGFATQHDVGAVSVGVRPQSREYDADQELAEYVRDNVLPLFKRRMWLFLRTGWLVPNRVTAHKKLWKHLQFDCRWDPSGFTRGEEIEIIDGNRTCYAGVMEAPVRRFSTVVEILRQCSGFVVLSNRSDFALEQNIMMMFDSAYPPNTYGEAEWQILSERMCTLEDVVVRLEPILDIPPRPYESALDLFMPGEELVELRERLAASA